MKGKLQWSLALLILGLGGWAGLAQARVTEKVDAMIAENSPLKVRDSDLWAMVGGPLGVGLQYEKFATAQVALGFGGGSYFDGTSLDLSVKYYFMNSKFSPFLAAGPVYYYSTPKQNLFGIFGVFGLSYFFDDGFGISFGVAYAKGLTKSDTPFAYTYINDSLSWVSPQLGLHLNF